MTDEECVEEVIITVFPPIPGLGIIEEEPVTEEEDSCGEVTPFINIPTQTDPNTRVFTLSVNNPMNKVNQLLEAAKDRFGDSICVRIAKYDTREQINEAIEWLNATLRGSGDNTVLDDHRFSSFLATSAPILSVNNRLSFVGMIPTENQFLSRISAALKLDS